MQNIKKLKILIAIDEPALAKTIVHTTCNIIDKGNSEITLLNVLETTNIEEEYFYKEPQKFIEHEAEKSDFAYLENFLENEEEIEYKGFIYREGHASKNILDVASNENYDLIVLGSHNKQGLRRFFLGSVSYNVSKYSKSSVLVIKPATCPQIPKDSNFSVLFAVDNSDFSTYVSGQIGIFLDKKRAEVTILNVTLPIQEIIPPDAYVYTDIAKIMEESNLVAEEIIRDAAINVAKQRLTVKNKYHITGDPASTIINEAEKNKSSLIIVGSHSKSIFSDFIMGSISTKIYEHSTLPVLIIKYAF
ncbi:MAG: universal stress protein [bacterium]